MGLYVVFVTVALAFAIGVVAVLRTTTGLQ